MTELLRRETGDAPISWLGSCADALRVRLHAGQGGTGSAARGLTRTYRICQRRVPVRAVHVYGMDMGWAASLRDGVDERGRS
jgi:hypothetical protein